MTTRIKSTKKFKALVAVLGSEEAALAAFERAEAPVVALPSPVEQLVAAGFTPEEAERALANAGAAVAPVEPAKPLTSKDRGEALVAERGLAFAKGRVYVGSAHAEAIVRVLRTGTPEIVQSSGVGRTVAVLVYKEESGDAALQNLSNPV